MFKSPISSTPPVCLSVSLPQQPAISGAIPDNITINDLVHPFATALHPSQPHEWRPVEEVREALQAVTQFLASATADQKADLHAAFDTIVSPVLKSDAQNITLQLRKDAELLQELVGRLVTSNNVSSVLKTITQEKLCLPNFDIAKDSGPEPSERDFASVLVPIAAAAYDYSPLGRTVMLEGARASFVGPSEPQRSERLRDIIFALPNPPASGTPLEDMGDIWVALDQLGMDV
jgi:hypothetical protein